MLAKEGDGSCSSASISTAWHSWVGESLVRGASDEKAWERGMEVDWVRSSVAGTDGR